MKTLHTLVLHDVNSNQLMAMLNNAKHHVVDYPAQNWSLDAGRDALDAIKALSLFQPEMTNDGSEKGRKPAGRIHPNIEVYEDRGTPPDTMVLYPANWEDKTQDTPCVKIRVTGSGVLR